MMNTTNMMKLKNSKQQSLSVRCISSFYSASALPGSRWKLYRVGYLSLDFPLEIIKGSGKIVH